MITSRNFCHIEIVEDGIPVLFYAEHEGDEVRVHQVVTCDIGTVDVALVIPAEIAEENWPLNFAGAAPEVIKTVRGMGFGFDVD